MTYFINRRGGLVLPAAAAALGLSAVGLAAGSGATPKTAATEAPLECEIAVSHDRYGHTYEGRVHAHRAVSGTYELTITRRGGAGHAMISQSGEFRLARGASESLGQATFGGLSPDKVNAELVLHWNGERLVCSNQSET